MYKTRKIDVIAAEINSNWQVIVNLPEMNQMHAFYPIDAEIVGNGLALEGLAHKPGAVPLVHNIAPDLLPKVGREMARLAEFARQAQINLVEGEIDDCRCVLPEHTCPTCRFAARKVVGNVDGLPF